MNIKHIVYFFGSPKRLGLEIDRSRHTIERWVANGVPHASVHAIAGAMERKAKMMMDAADKLRRASIDAKVKHEKTVRDF